VLIRFICVIRVPIRLLVLTARHAKENRKVRKVLCFWKICVCFSIIDKKIRVNPFYLRYPRTNQVVSFNRKARKGLRKASKVLGFEVNLCNMCLSSSIPKKIRVHPLYLCHPCSIFLRATETNG
jgi:hypothetical protein